MGNNSSIVSLLRAQASELPNASSGRLFASVEQNIVSKVFIFLFQIGPRGRPEHTYELFRLKAPSGQFPVALEINHFEGKQRNQKATDIVGLENILRDVFSDSGTTEILNLVAESAAQQDESALDGSPILIGAQMFKGSDELLCAMMSFFGVSSVVNIDTIRRLIGEPDTKGSAYVSLGAERFVATVPVSDALKMTVTKRQIEALRSAARITLSSGATMPKDD